MANSSIYLATQGGKNDSEFERFRVPQLIKAAIDPASFIGPNIDYTPELFLYSDTEIKFNSSGTSQYTVVSTNVLPQSTGKWYHEITLIQPGSGSTIFQAGFHDATVILNNGQASAALSVSATEGTGSFGYQYTTQYNILDVGLQWFDSGCRTNQCGFSANGTLGISLDLDNNTIAFKFNSPDTTRPTQAFTNTGNYVPDFSMTATARYKLNFGDDPYVLGKPAGYNDWTAGYSN